MVAIVGLPRHRNGSLLSEVGETIVHAVQPMLSHCLDCHERQGSWEMGNSRLGLRPREICRCQDDASRCASSTSPNIRVLDLTCCVVSRRSYAILQHGGWSASVMGNDRFVVSSPEVYLDGLNSAVVDLSQSTILLGGGRRSLPHGLGWGGPGALLNLFPRDSTPRLHLEISEASPP